MHIVNLHAAPDAWFSTFAVGNILPCIPIERVTSVSPVEESGFLQLRQHNYLNSEAVFRGCVLKNPSGYAASFGLTQSLYTRLPSALGEAKALYNKSQKGSLTTAECLRGLFLAGLCTRNSSELVDPATHLPPPELTRIAGWARTQYSRLVRQPAESPLQAMFLADVHDELDWKLIDIKNYLGESIKIFPGNAWLRFQMAQYCASSNELVGYKEPLDPGQELKQLLACVKLQPDYPTFHIKLAFAYLQLNRKADAHSEWSKAQSLGIETSWDRELAKIAEKSQM